MSAPAVNRSYLFVPATRVERVPKALAAGAHAVIIDLEDAVAPADKAAARQALSGGLSDARAIFVRVNGPDTEWFVDDIALCATLGVRGVLIPKAETAEQLGAAAARLPSGTVLLPLIETARGFENREALCTGPNVERLVFGSIDFQLDLGITGERDELLFFRSAIVLASRLCGVQPPVDGVTVDIRDVERVREDTLYSKNLGFGGKLCIHPNQVATVNECYSPTAGEIEWAKRIIEAAGAAAGGAVAVDGKMVDKPVLVKAEQILRESGEAR